MDFGSWLETVGSKITGLTATHWEPDTNHLWRFTWAAMLQNVNVGAINVQHKEWGSLEAHGKDVVMLAKQYLGSETWSQDPLLVMPHSIRGPEIRPQSLGS